MTDAPQSLVSRLRAVKTCNEEPGACVGDSGPYCQTHGEAYMFVALLREAADALEDAQQADELRKFEELRARAESEAALTRELGEAKTRIAELLNGAEIVPLRGGPDRIAFLKEQP